MSNSEPSSYETSASETSQHILKIASDLAEYRQHRKRDAEIREELRKPANQNLRNPQTRDDYFKLVKKIIDGYTLVNYQSPYNDKIVKEKYTGENVSDEVWTDFKRMVDMCLVHGRFRAIRTLADFYTHIDYYQDHTTPLRWDRVVTYFFPRDSNVDWESEPEVATP